MSQENVEIVRRFYEAGQRSIEAYWENPRLGADALEAGDLDPETETHRQQRPGRTGRKDQRPAGFH